MSETEAKRRRISCEGEQPPPTGAVVPITPLSSEEGQSHNDYPPATTVQQSVPNLSEMATLILVQLRSPNTEIVIPALERLADLFETPTPNNKNSPAVKNRMEAHVLGPIPVLTAIMLTPSWKSHYVIQKLCCYCLSMLMYVHHSSCKALIVSGGLEAIANAMRNFPNSVELQHEAMRTLIIFFEASDTFNSMSKAAEKSFVQVMDGLALIVNIMTVCSTPEYEEAQIYGMKFLSRAARSKDLHAALLTSGALSAVARVVESNPGGGTLRRCAFAFMASIVRDQDRYE